MKKRLTAVLLIAVLILIFGYGSAFASIPDAPDPFYAADFANVLNTDTEDYIIEQNGILENFCGAQIVVVTTDFSLLSFTAVSSRSKNKSTILLSSKGNHLLSFCIEGLHPDKHRFGRAGYTFLKVL